LLLSGQAVVTVVMPSASARRHPVDLLLCGHHYRVCRAALTAAGATVYDETGALINTGGGGHEPARPRARRCRSATMSRRPARVSQVFRPCVPRGGRKMMILW
jgi:hypothetical protein